MRKLKIQKKELQAPETETMTQDVDEGSITLLDAVNGILVIAEDSELSDEFFEMARFYLKYMTEKLNISQIQAVMLSLFIETSASGGSSSLSDVADFLDCRNVRVLMYESEVKELVKRGMLRQTQRSYDNTIQYSVPERMMEAIKKDEPFKQKSYKGCDGVKFFQCFYDITHLRHENELSTNLMVDEIQRLFDENKDSHYVKTLKALGVDQMCEVVITQFARHLVLGGNEELPIDHLNFLYDEKHDKYDFSASMVKGTNFLIQGGLVEYVCEDGLQNTKCFRLADNFKTELLKDYDITTAPSGLNNVLSAEQIVERQLFFDEKVQKQLDVMYHLLSEEHYQNICERLQSKGMRRGFACLFYGAPGTGKTESVLQLARQTGRDIIQVNISEVKSKWVGESEKNIKAIFDQYRSVARRSKKTPILLFNEADAVISKRMEGVDREVDKMSNAIQNIILQEMESLEGIMIATTNLAQNMDSAFERRFLYKVKFEKPAQAQRIMIWKNMVPRLSETGAGRLASYYDFSGGQIENIARKCDIESILYGEDTIDDAKVEEYCREESIEKKAGHKIGFF